MLDLGNRDIFVSEIRIWFYFPEWGFGGRRLGMKAGMVPYILVDLGCFVLQ